MMPTGSAVVSDTVSAASGIINDALRRRSYAKHGFGGGGGMEGMAGGDEAEEGDLGTGRDLGAGNRPDQLETPLLVPVAAQIAFFL